MEETEGVLWNYILGGREVEHKQQSFVTRTTIGWIGRTSIFSFSDGRINGSHAWTDERTEGCARSIARSHRCLPRARCELPRLVLHAVLELKLDYELDERKFDKM